jgi:hypothetical protein
MHTIDEGLLTWAIKESVFQLGGDPEAQALHTEVHDRVLAHFNRPLVYKLIFPDFTLLPPGTPREVPPIEEVATWQAVVRYENECEFFNSVRFVTDLPAAK